MAGRAHLKRKIKDADDAHSRIPSSFTCPDCQGTLFLVRENDFVRFRCRIGHLYSPENMFEAQSENVERLMWSAARALEEQADYTSQMAEKVARTSAGLAREYQAISRDARRKAEVMHKLIVDDPPQKTTAHAKRK
ncbi:MAG TPA: hypothetical protein VGR47_13850 [Terracidiphilus sp.]|nr:hypothetical protein [Terracidiphilus sp.]